MFINIIYKSPVSNIENRKAQSFITKNETSKIVKKKIPV